MEANQLKLYRHFLATEQLDRAEEILKVYSDFEKEGKKELKEAKKKK